MSSIYKVKESNNKFSEENCDFFIADEHVHLREKWKTVYFKL